jgi:hypothetical protein
MKKAHYVCAVVLAALVAGPVVVSAQYVRPVAERNELRELEGRWYANGDRDKQTQIYSTRKGPQAKNERGQVSRLQVDRRGNIRALDWAGGLRGNFRRDRIEWANGTIWTRSPRRR